MQNLSRPRVSVGRGAVLSALAEPQQHSAKDEDDASRDPDDDRPRERAGRRREDCCQLRLCVYNRTEARKTKIKQMKQRFICSMFTFTAVCFSLY